MKRALAIFVATGLLLVPAISAMAAGPVSFEFKSATLLAKGVGVLVEFDAVCEPVDGTTDAMVDWGSAQIDQRAGKTIIHGWGSSFGFMPITCDGSTATPITVLVRADTMPFKQGSALVSAELCIYDLDNYHSYRCGQDQAALRIRR